MTTPLFVGEATVSLYPADGAGNPITGSPFWTGREAEGLVLDQERATTVFIPTGADAAENRPTGPVTHSISMRSLWLLRSDLTDHQFPAGPLVMVITWNTMVAGQAISHTRTYRGVRENRWSVSSDGVHELASEIRLVASRMS